MTSLREAREQRSAGLVEEMARARRTVLRALARPALAPCLEELADELEARRLPTWEAVVDGGSPGEPERTEHARASAIEALMRATVRLREGDSSAAVDVLEEVGLSSERLRILWEALQPELSEAQARETERCWREYNRARSSLVAEHLGLVHTIARRHFARGLDHGDLVQEGCFGLLRAADKFDAERGVRFATYAGWWVQQSIRRALSMKGRMVRLPIRAAQDRARVQRHRQRHHARTGLSISSDELMRLAGLDATRLREVDHLPAEASSLSGQEERHGGTSEGDAASAPVVAAQERAMLSVMIDALPEREAHVVKRYYGFDGGPGCSLAVLGEQLGVTRERVRQIKVGALARLRKHHGPLLDELRAS